MKKLKEKCGVFGIHDIEDASALTALGLHALQHRGQEGCGIVSFDGKIFTQKKDKDWLVIILQIKMF